LKAPLYSDVFLLHVPTGDVPDREWIFNSSHSAFFLKKLDQRKRLKLNHILREITDDIVFSAGNVYDPCVGVNFLHQDPKQRRFSAAVLADQTDTALGMNRPVQIIEKLLSRKDR